MNAEANFLESLGLEFGQQRSRDVLALYLKGLRTSRHRRTLANVADAVCSDPAEASRLVERFNYQLNDRHDRTGISWAPELMKAVARRALAQLQPHSLQAFQLVRMPAPRLGSGLIRSRDVVSGSAQMVASLLAVGRGPTGDTEGFPIGWKLALDGWTVEDFARAGMERTMHDTEQLSVSAASMLADVRMWGLPDLPIFASASFAELRFVWLSAGRSYVVQWQMPKAEATVAVPERPRSPALTFAEELAQLDEPESALQDEIAQRSGTYWRDVRRPTTQRTRRGVALRTDLVSRWGTQETDVEIGDSVWCAHLPPASHAAVVDRILDYDMLCQDASAVYTSALPTLGLNDYRGRRLTGWYAHRALVSAAHLLTREEAWARRSRTPSMPTARAESN